MGEEEGNTERTNVRNKGNIRIEKNKIDVRRKKKKKGTCIQAG